MVPAAARSLPFLLLAHFPLVACIAARAPVPPVPASAAPALEGTARARYHYLVARAEQERGNFAAAGRALDAASLYEPRSSWLALARADLARARGDAAAAVFDAEAAVALDPASAEAHAVLGLAQYRAGNREGAEAALRAAVDLGATGTAWAVLSTLAVERAAEDAPALVARWSAVALTDVDERSMRANLRVRTGDARGAVDDWAAVLAARPADRAAMESLVRAATVAGRYRTALQALQRAVLRAPGNTDLARALATLAEEAGDAARAIDGWSRLSALPGGRGDEALAHLAMAATHAGRYELALDACARARGRLDAEWLAVLRARVHAAQENWREVRKDLRGARSMEALRLLAAAEAALGPARASTSTRPSPIEEMRDAIAPPPVLPRDPWSRGRTPDPRRDPALQAARQVAAPGAAEDAQAAAAAPLLVVLDAAPADVEALSVLASLEGARGRPLHAAAYLDEALLHAPGDATLIARRDGALADARAQASR